MSEICLDCGTDITGPEVLCELCTKLYVYCQHGQRESKCETCKYETQLTAATLAREQAENELAMMKAALSTPEGYVGVVTQELEDERDAWALKCKALTAANAELVEFVRSLNRCVTEVNDHREKGYKGTMSVDAKYWMIESERVLKTLAAHPAGEKHEQQDV